MKDEKYRKVRDHCYHTEKYRGTAHSIYSLAKKIPTFFINGSNYDHDFIIKELAEEFKKQFSCLAENTEKCMTFTVPKRLQELIKMEKKLQEIGLPYNTLLIAQDLWYKCLWCNIKISTRV